MDETNRKLPTSVNLPRSLKRILKNYGIERLSRTFNIFFDYFETQMNYLYYECDYEKGLKNTTINIPEDRVKFIEELVNIGVFTSQTEGARFIYFLGIFELHKKNKFLLDLCIKGCKDTEIKEKIKVEEKEKKKESDKELEKILSKVISIDEYHRRNGTEIGRKENERIHRR